MRVLITGLPLFSKRLAEDLQNFDNANSYKFYNTYYSKLDLIRFLLAVPFCDIVISLNGVTERSRTLNWVMKWKKPLVMQWTGSDALGAIDNFEKGTIKRDYIDYANNWVDSPWMMDEVLSLKVTATHVRYKFFSSKLRPVERYEKLAVTSYVAQNRQEFYGFPWMIKLAELNPEIPFVIFGVEKSDYPLPKNMECKGWRPSEEVVAAIQKAPISLRFTEHDGYSVAAIEALSLGAEVLNRLPMERTHLVNEENLVDTFNQVCDLVKSRDFKPNLKQSEEVLADFDQQKILGNYITQLKRIL